jgi:hypothetical protein
MSAERIMEKTLEDTGAAEEFFGGSPDRDGQWLAEIRAGGCPGRDVVGALCIMDAIVFLLTAIDRGRPRGRPAALHWSLGNGPDCQGARGS